MFNYKHMEIDSQAFRRWRRVRRLGKHRFMLIFGGFQCVLIFVMVTVFWLSGAITHIEAVPLITMALIFLLLPGHVSRTWESNEALYHRVLSHDERKKDIEGFRDEAVIAAVRRIGEKPAKNDQALNAQREGRPQDD